MKTIIALGLCTFVLACQAAVQRPQQELRPTDRNFYFPDGKGKLHRERLPDKTNRPVDDEVQRKDVDFHLYTKDNKKKSEELKVGDERRWKKSNVDEKKGLVILVHGWRANHKSTAMTKIRDSYLRNYDVNVVIVDWSRVAKHRYHDANRRSEGVAKLVAHFIEFAKNMGVSNDKMHIIGNSVGAHVAGMASRIARVQVRRLTGLDPAAPYWMEYTDKAIKDTDADYVEIIHTNAGNLGLKMPRGDSDFYPNGGKFMKGCRRDDIACHHRRAYKYFAESIDNKKFLANKCRSENEAMEGRCDGNADDRFYLGGADFNKNGEGIYHLETTDNAPFYRKK